MVGVNYARQEWLCHHVCSYPSTIVVRTPFIALLRDGSVGCSKIVHTGSMKRVIPGPGNLRPAPRPIGKHKPGDAASAAKYQAKHT
jgi:hypothetical protein